MNSQRVGAITQSLLPSSDNTRLLPLRELPLLPLSAVVWESHSQPQGWAHATGLAHQRSASPKDRVDLGRARFTE